MAERRRIPIHIEEADAHYCTPEVRRHVLADVPFFADLKVDELPRVDSRARAAAYQADEAIYLAGFEADRLFVVATGVVKTTRTSSDGRETVVDVLGPGDFLGALPALGSPTYPDSAWALSPACVLVFGVEDFERILDDFPSVARSALEAVSQRLTHTQQALHRSGATVEQRVASVLLDLAGKLGEEWREGVLVHAPLSRDDLAALTGARPETVSRVLSEWRRKGLVDTGRRWIALRDPAALAEASDR